MYYLLMSLLLLFSSFQTYAATLFKEEKSSATSVFLEYQRAAKQGDAEAQYNLGVCYALCYFGDKVENNNLNKAAFWYTKSAEQGNVFAQYNLGICYFYGHGVEKDLNKAFEWYTKSAEQGYALAQNFLGLCYEYGKGVAEDPSKAFEWYTKAAAQGYLEAQWNLEIVKKSLKLISNGKQEDLSASLLKEDNKGQLENNAKPELPAPLKEYNPAAAEEELPEPLHYWKRIYHFHMKNCLHQLE